MEYPELRRQWKYLFYCKRKFKMFVNFCSCFFSSMRIQYKKIVNIFTHHTSVNNQMKTCIVCCFATKDFFVCRKWSSLLDSKYLSEPWQWKAPLYVTGMFVKGLKSRPLKAVSYINRKRARHSLEKKILFESLWDNIFPLTG